MFSARVQNGFAIMTGLTIEGRAIMGGFVGLDVSLNDTAVSVRREGKMVCRSKCASDPQALAALIRKHVPEVERVVFETGPLSIWFYHALSAEGLWCPN